MSGRRRVQRSTRVTAAAVLVVISGALVVVSTAVSAAVGAAAIVSVVAGAAATRMMYAEVVQSRQEASRGRAEQARAFGAALTTSSAEHSAFTALMTSHLVARNRTIAELDGTIRLAEKRAEEAQARSEHESHRADDAQARLSALLDEVLAHQVAPSGADDHGNPDGDSSDDDLPTVVDLLAWEERAKLTLVEDLRKHA